MKQKKFPAGLATAATAFVLAAGLAMSSASAASAVTAAAAPAPTISFSFAQQGIDSGAHAKLTYSGRNLPATVTAAITKSTSAYSRKTGKNSHLCPGCRSGVLI